MERIRVEASRTYDVVIGSNVLETLGTELVSLIKGKRCVIIADDITDCIYGRRIKASLEGAGFSVESFVFPHGEESKSAENFISILEFLAVQKLTRADCLIALGGGVVGDITGFAAATYLRGISFVQIPTTLLSAVDSSVGGKTAINLNSGKNLAGAFYQPSLVLCDTDIINDLPDEIFSDGMAEVIKYGALGSEKVLDLCKAGARENITEVISECIKMKRDIVAQDEFDTGLRSLLNLGHTPAHGIEKLSDFKISHGKSVAIGMCLMARAAEKAGMCDVGVAEETEALCKKYNLPTVCPFTPEDIAEVAMSDKKRSADTITLVLPKKRGKSILHKADISEVVKFFRLGLEAVE